MPHIFTILFVSTLENESGLKNERGLIIFTCTILSKWSIGKNGYSHSMTRAENIFSTSLKSDKYTDKYTWMLNFLTIIKSKHVEIDTLFSTVGE